MNIVYVFDENFAVCAAVSMVSLLENNKEIQDICFHIFEDGISSKSKERLHCICGKYGAQIIFYDVQPVCAKLEEMNVQPWRGRYSAYVKLMISSFLPQGIERAVVLDADTIVIGDIQELDTMDLHGHPCAMALEGIHGDYQLISGVGKSELYNTGVIVYDLPVWREKKVEERFVNHLTNVCCRYMLPEEDPISIVLRGDVERLRPEYNFIAQYTCFATERYFRRFHWDRLEDKFYTLQQIQQAKKAPRICHCIDMFTSRPWFEENIHPYRDLYDHYLMMTPWKDVPKRKENMSRMAKIEYLIRKYTPYAISNYFYYFAARWVYTKRAKRFYKK